VLIIFKRRNYYLDKNRITLMKKCWLSRYISRYNYSWKYRWIIWL